jgi:hypothetical protein
MSGGGPGRCGTTVGSIPFLLTGVYFDSAQSQLAKGRLQRTAMVVFFFDGDVRR